MRIGATVRINVLNGLTITARRLKRRIDGAMEDGIIVSWVSAMVVQPCRPKYGLVLGECYTVDISKTSAYELIPRYWDN
jgi:hypothetical protein